MEAGFEPATPVPSHGTQERRVSFLSAAVIRYITKCALGKSLFGLIVPEGEESITARGTAAGAGRSHLSHMQEAEGANGK